MASHQSVIDSTNSYQNRKESTAPQKDDTKTLIEQNSMFNHRAKTGGVEFSEISTVHTDNDGTPYITDMGHHVNLYLDGGIPHVTLTEKQVEEEDTGMEGERNTTRNTNSIHAGHELYSERRQFNTSRNWIVYELDDGRPLILSFRYIPKQKRERIAKSAQH